MNKTLYLLIGAAAGAAATYLYLNPAAANAVSGRIDDVGLDSAADQANRWGSKQRVTGLSNNVVGKVKQGFGEATGDEKLASDGVVDQVKGALKDAAGQAAHAAVDVVQGASK